MMIRRLRFKKDRVLYALDKKMVKDEMLWKDGDVISQYPDSYKYLILFNESMNERLPKGYRTEPDMLKEIVEMNFQKEKEYYKIKKKYPKDSKGFKIALAKLNRGLSTEEEAKGEKKITVRRLKQTLAGIEIEIKKLELKKENIKEQIKKCTKAKKTIIKKTGNPS